MADQSREPFLGVPAGGVRVENPDGVFNHSPHAHSLYDTGPLAMPVIPGDFDKNVDVNRKA